MARAKKRLYICVNNSGYEVSLERRKIYVALSDARANALDTSGSLMSLATTTSTRWIAFFPRSCPWPLAAQCCKRPNNWLERTR